MDLYKFSPIKEEETFKRSLIYIVSELDKLARNLLNEPLPISSVKIFAHYPEEYNYLHSLISRMGPAAPFNSKTSFYVQTNQTINEHNIKYVGVRTIDPYRMQAGCGDYEISNYLEVRNKYLGKTDYVRDFNGEMIELWHPDFDVLGYITPTLEQ